MRSTATEVHDLHKSDDGQPALRGPSLSFRAGEIFGITIVALSERRRRPAGGW